MAKLIGRYFFLVVFFAGAFFFAAMVLFSLGLDLVVLVPGFFVAGIGYPPLRSLLLGKRRTLWMSLRPIGFRHYRNALWWIQAFCSIFIKKF
jgi:hypothetical protein